MAGNYENRTPSARSTPSLTTPSAGLVTAVLAALAAVWIVSGSAGLMAHPWRRVLTWMAIGCVVMFAWPPRDATRWRGVQVLAVLGGVVLAVLLVGAMRPAVGMLGVVILLGCLALAHQGTARSVLLATAGAALVAAVFRVAMTSFGRVWLLADRIGYAMGLAGWGFVGGPFCKGALGTAPWIGASMAGLEIFLLMLVLAPMVAWGIPGPRRRDGWPAVRLLLAWFMVIVAQLVYLGAFTLLGALAAQAPQEKPPPSRLEALIYGKPMPPLELIAAKIAVGHWWTEEWKSPLEEESRGEPSSGEPSQDEHSAQGGPSPQSPTGEKPADALPPGVFDYVAQRVTSRVNHWLYNLPLLAVVVQLAAAWAILSWLGGFSPNEGSGRTAPAQEPVGRRRRGGWETVGGAIGAEGILLATAGLLIGTAFFLGITGTLTWQKPHPKGRKIVLYEKGFLNWLKPKHGEYGRYSVGMYGMMPTYLRSLGLRPVISSDLSERDLKDASAVVLLFPNEPWKKEQLERLWSFVREGGTLLLMGEHTVLKAEEPADKLARALAASTASKPATDDKQAPEEKADKKKGKKAKPQKRATPLFTDNPINQVLKPTAMRVAFDSATFAVGGWLQSYQTLSHPTTLGIDDQRNTFGVVIGASVLCRPPARPLIIGRWGWADPGDERKGPSMMGDHLYDPGEKLGDLVLAAEQPLGKGRVVVFGDTSGLTNGLTVGCHEYTSRLFAYLVTRTGTPQSAWRQVLGVCLAGLFVVGLGLALRLRSPTLIGTGAFVLAVTLVAAQHTTYRQWRVLPDGRLVQPRPNNLAYVDAALMNLYSREGWRPDGVMGLCLTLMREDFLTLLLPEITADRLESARLLVSVAPGREPTRREREVIKEFVRSGGIYICTVGYDPAGPSRQLLKEFGFQVGPRPWPPTRHQSSAVLQPVEGPLGGVLDRVAGRERRKPGPKESAGAGTANPELVEPEPLGHFKSPYFNHGDYLAFVRFHAAWPVWYIGPEDERRQVLEVTHYPPDKPIIVVRRFGEGLVAVIGDTCFAMNKNLEHEDGSPFEGLRENAWFWRYFLCLLRDRTAPDGTREVPMWYPPNPATYREPGAVFMPAQPARPATPLPGVRPPQQEAAPEATPQPTPQPEQSPPEIRPPANVPEQGAAAGGLQSPGRPDVSSQEIHPQEDST